MPIYEYTCGCSSEIKERLLNRQDCDLPQTCSICGEIMQKKLSLVNVQSLDSSLVFTKEGKAAKGQDMALRTLNSKGDNQTGPTSRYSGDKYKRAGLLAAVAGL